MLLDVSDFVCRLCLVVSVWYWLCRGHVIDCVSGVKIASAQMSLFQFHTNLSGDVLASLVPYTA